MCQRGLNLAEINRVTVKGMFMTDGFGLPLFAYFAFKPCACIFTARLAGQRRSPLAEILFQDVLFHLQQIANVDNADIVEARLGDFADSENLSYIQRRQETLL